MNPPRDVGTRLMLDSAPLGIREATVAAPSSPEIDAHRSSEAIRQGLGAVAGGLAGAGVAALGLPLMADGSWAHALLPAVGVGAGAILGSSAARQGAGDRLRARVGPATAVPAIEAKTASWGQVLGAVGGGTLGVLAGNLAGAGGAALGLPLMADGSWAHALLPAVGLGAGAILGSSATRQGAGDRLRARVGPATAVQAIEAKTASWGQVLGAVGGGTLGALAGDHANDLINNSALGGHFGTYVGAHPGTYLGGASGAIAGTLVGNSILPDTTPTEDPDAAAPLVPPVVTAKQAGIGQVLAVVGGAITGGIVGGHVGGELGSWVGHHFHTGLSPDTLETMGHYGVGIPLANASAAVVGAALRPDIASTLTVDRLPALAAGVFDPVAAGEKARAEAAADAPSAGQALHFEETRLRHAAA